MKKSDPDPLVHKAKILSGGIVIDEKKTNPCDITVLENSVLKFLMKEGRNRQIRKMCEAMELEVLDLLRVRIGKLKLGEMKPGKFRILSETEIESL